MASDRQLLSKTGRSTDVQSTVIAISSILLMVAGGVSILSAVYSKYGFHLRHGIPNKNFKESISDCSDWSDESEYQLLSITTITSIADDDSSSEMGKVDVCQPVRAHQCVRAMKSLPNSPLTGVRRANRVNLSILSQSSSTILQRVARHQDQLKQLKIDRSKCSIYSLNDCGRREDIEMCEMMTADSQVTLKLGTEEEKVLNTKFLSVSSSQETCTSYNKSSISFATASISDQEFELDYYDLDVYNTGDVADSFLRCIDEDDVIFWDPALIDTGTCSTSSVNFNPSPLNSF